LTDLLDFSKTVSFSKITDYIQQKANEKEKLEQKIEELNNQKWSLLGKISELETRHYVALEEEKITADNLKWYSDLKAELGKNGISVEDISKLATIVKNIREYGYDPRKVIDEFSNLESARDEYKDCQEGISSLRSQYDSLNQEYLSLDRVVNSHKQTISVYKDLESMGFDLKGLKLLRNTINEIASSNSIPLHDSLQKFYRDIEEQYDDKLGFESKIDSLKNDVKKLRDEENRLRKELFTLPLVGSALLRLIQSGVKEQDIIDIAELLKADGGGIGTSFITTEKDRQLLVDELHKYGGIKSTIKQLSQQVEELRNEVASLEAKKQDLNTQHNQKMSSTSVYSKQSLDFFDLAALEHKVPSEYVPLIRAARHMPINISEFELAVRKVIKEVVLARQNTADKETEKLPKEGQGLINEEL
jgi:prefoldin subunit 5